MNYQIDLSGQNCPIPLMKTKKRLSELATGEMLEVIATDPNSKEDFRRYCDGGYCSIQSMEQRGRQFIFMIRKEAYP